MSEPRKFLVAKRPRTRAPTKGPPVARRPSKEGPKREACDAPRRNSANERLKRLRTSLREDVLRSESREPSRKRPWSEGEGGVPKVQKRVEDSAAGQSTAMEWSVVAENHPSDDILNKLYVIVDTNIFIANLSEIKEIVSRKLQCDDVLPVIYIPWIVIEELDFIKDDTKKTIIKLKAQAAIKYIEKTLLEKNGRMEGQSLEDASRQKATGKSQDNKIMACCLQVQEKHQKMVLLTSDINLRNKAHLNNIPVCSLTELSQKFSKIEPPQKLSKLTPKTPKIHIIFNKMTDICSVVIRECAKNAYGNAYEKMAIGKSPLKTLDDCITIFIKYWFPVFQEVLMKQFKNSIEDLSSFMKKSQSITNDSKETTELVRLCVRVCLFLKDIESCRNLIENTISELNNLKGL